MPLTRFDRLPNIGLETIDPTAPTSVLRDRAKRVSAFMNGVQKFYTRDLGLRWIDTDSFSSPNNHKETQWRVGRFRASGLDIERSGLQFLLAHHLGSSDELPKYVNSLAGFLVLRKPQGLCVGDQHTSTEVLEWDVAPPYRSRGVGLGRFMLKEAMTGVHPQDLVTLKVAEQNANARKVYEHYGFAYDADVSEEQGLFATIGDDGGVVPVRHIGMKIPADRLQQRLDVVYTPPETS